MKYGLAILACFGIFMIYVLINAAFDWRNGGGALPMVIFAMAIITAWRGIMKMDLSSIRPNSPGTGSSRQNNQSTAGEGMPDIEEQFYEIAAREVAEKKFNPGMMAKAFSEADGDEKKAIARYIKYRVGQLAEQAEQQEEQRRRSLRKQFAASQKPSNTVERDKLHNMSGGNDAINFAYSDGKKWMCVCGTKNLYYDETEVQNCVSCRRNRNFVLKNCSKEALCG